jgi:hypothetical protein
MPSGIAPTRSRAFTHARWRVIAEVTNACGTVVDQLASGAVYPGRGGRALEKLG